MKIAICFYGLVGSKSKKYGLGENLDPQIAFKYYKENVFKDLKDYDIFIHSQSFEKRKLLDLYNLKQALLKSKIFLNTIFHPQILFPFFYTL